MKNVTNQEWKDLTAQDDNKVILDVRTPEEVAEGIIPGAINIDIFLGAGFVEQVQQLDQDKTYYVYCRAGSRSAQACGVMESLGFNKTTNLSGGFSNWDGEVGTL